MPKFRKSELVEAVQWHKFGDHPAVQSHAGHSDGVDEHTYPPLPDGCGWIATIEGGHVVHPGDWIVVGANGQPSHVREDTFRQTYEPAA